MNIITNPFAPGAGSPPPELAGRSPILEQGSVLCRRILANRSEKSLLLTGLRGTGKTVLLNTMLHHAENLGIRTVFTEAHLEKPLSFLLASQLRTILYDLNRLAGAGNLARRGLAVLVCFVNGLQLSIGEVNLGIDVQPETGTADSGDIETDLPQLFLGVALAAQEKRTAIALLIDEIQFLSKEELSALIMSMHLMQQRQLPLMLIGAGLPVLPQLAGEARTYAERLFSFPEVGPLSPEDSARALQVPVNQLDVHFTDEALDDVFKATQGYPYFLQEWGYQAWNLSESPVIGVDLIRQASEKVSQRLDQDFFRVRFDRMSPREKAFLLAMAKIGTEICRTGEVAELLRVPVSATGPLRGSLIRKGMIFSPGHGLLSFSVPLFGEFMLRTE